MAKNKNRSGFDKFNSGPAVADPPHVVPVEEEDDKDVEEPTDPLPRDDDSGLPPVDPPDAGDAQGRGNVPIGAYQALNAEAMTKRTIAEQEEVLAKMHPKNNRMRDPALDYTRCLVSGRSLPEFKAKEGTDPLLIRTKDFLERILAGGLIVPSAYGVYNQGVDLVADIIKATGVSDAPKEATGAQT